MAVNSSSAVDRFVLAPGESKTFFTGDLPNQPLSGNKVVADVHGAQDQSMSGVPKDDGGTTVLLEDSQDNISFGTVATAAVVNRGSTVLSGSVKRYFRFRNTGNGAAAIVAKELIGAQITPAL